MKSNSENHLLSQLILEYLDYFDLKFTKSVLLPEANLEQEDRESVLEKLENSSHHHVTSDLGTQEPLLLQLFTKWLHNVVATTSESVSPQLQPSVQQQQQPEFQKSPTLPRNLEKTENPPKSTLNNLDTSENSSPKNDLNQFTQQGVSTKESVIAPTTVSPSLSLDDSFEEEQLSSTMKKRKKKSKTNNDASISPPLSDGSKSQESSPSENTLAKDALSQKLPPLKPLVGLKTRDSSSPPLESVNILSSGGSSTGNSSNISVGIFNNNANTNLGSTIMEKKHSPKESTFLTKAFDDSELDISDIEPSPKSERSNHSQLSNQSPKSNHSQLSTHSIHSTHSQKSNHSIHSEHLSEKSLHITHSIHSHKSNTSEKSNRSEERGGGVGEKQRHHHEEMSSFHSSDHHNVVDDNVYNFDEDFGDIEGNYAEDGDFGEDHFDGDTLEHQHEHEDDELMGDHHQNDEEISGFSGSEFNDNYSDDFKDYESNPSNQSNHSLNEFSDHTAHSENFDDVENVLEDSF
nr:unnamed protein product [Naegleria fowleri]